MQLDHLTANYHFAIYTVTEGWISIDINQLT